MCFLSAAISVFSDLLPGDLADTDLRGYATKDTTSLPLCPWTIE